MPETLMLINYAPGDECRVAIVEDGKLEEYYAEPTDHISRVNNIYVGRVTNVEPAIQAAFVDFGIGENGFLHVSDVHPMYFPGEGDETTERVGKKTPRRERPPIQECFRRGDEVTVQVLKEGVGTKGPTLTSYLSIPGRYLVMMPNMDRVGVSRKVEDEDLRRRMRDILDQLDLPEGFGFIVRTAGLDRTKAELKRDLAYLQRLWKDMERRRKGGNRPRLLYSESDLLVRVIRDLLTNDISQLVIDHPVALRRAARFMKIVSPRAQAKLMAYTGRTPLFHAYGIEPQILTMHAREVPLPGGGRLVIDETEALVAIDVNSGRMRDARDAETNAYRTNIEAVDEICRQLRLRDLGGIIINDLIDMRDIRKRREVEQRFKERLKRDRARTTTLAISEFGILEMTRQRMRGSHERQHFQECHICRGRGLLQKPGSVIGDGLRELAYLLSYERIARVEMVVSPRVASALLSGRRRMLGRIERASGKAVEVRVSETVPIDRVTFYAYDASGADVTIDKLPPLTERPQLEPWTTDITDDDDEAAMIEPDDVDEEPTIDEPLPGEQVAEEPDQAQAAGQPDGRKRRRRGRRGRGGRPAPEPHAQTPEPSAQPDEAPAPEAPGDAPPAEGVPIGESNGQGPGGRRRRRRRGRRGGGGGDRPPQAQPQEVGVPAPAMPMEEVPVAEAAPQGGPTADGQPASEDGQRRRRRRRGRGGRGRSEAQAFEAHPEAAERPQNGQQRAQNRRPRREQPNGAPAPAAPVAAPPPLPPGPASAAPAGAAVRPPVRSLYASRRKLLPSEKKRPTNDRS